MRPSVGQAVQLGRAEASQNGKVALCVFVVDLDHAANEELLLFGSAGLPVVGLCDCDEKALVSSPQLLLLLVLVLGLHVHVVLDGRQVFHGPRLANGEGAIGVLSGLVQLDSARVADRDHDDAPLLVRGRGGGRRRRLGVGGILLDADVGDVRLLQLALLVDFGEAALGDAAPLVVEALGTRHAGRGGA